MAFRFDKLTQKAQEAVQQAQQLASENGHQAVHPLHLLLALTAEREGIVRPVLDKCGVIPDGVEHEAQRQLASIPKVSGASPGQFVSPSLQRGVGAAAESAGGGGGEGGAAERRRRGGAGRRYD